MRYSAFGETRYSADTTPTDRLYTGQRKEEIGLYYYVARFYDPALAHFVQADTLVPGAGNPMAFNRYSYVSYNPLRYIDPSGHWGCLPGMDGGNCGNRGSDQIEEEYKKATIEYPWFSDTVSKKDFTAGKIYFGLFSQNSELGRSHKQNHTSENPDYAHFFAAVYAEYTGKDYDPFPEHGFVEEYHAAVEDGSFWKVFWAGLTLGGLETAGNIFANKNQFTLEQQAVLDLAQEASRRPAQGKNPLTHGEANTLRSWAQEYGVHDRTRINDIINSNWNPTGYGPISHIHIGRYHVPVYPDYYLYSIVPLYGQ